MIEELEQFRQDLGKFRMTKAQEDELLLTLWQIMCAFVDLGWGVDSLQLRFGQSAQMTSEPASDEVFLEGYFTTQQFEEAASFNPPELEDS